MNKVKIKNDGYVTCRSTFYTAELTISDETEYKFSTGINKLVGEIDSPNWGISYLLSMYKHKPDDFILFAEPKVWVDDEYVSLNNFSDCSCYMDLSYPLFSTEKTVEILIKEAVAEGKSTYSFDELVNMFFLDEQRVIRPLSANGNEKFRAMAAIALAKEKNVFCFPWFSKMRFEYYHNNLTWLLDILEKLEKIIVLPVGFD